MSICKRSILKPLTIGMGVTAIVTVAGILYAVSHPRQATPSAQLLQPNTPACKIVVFDPNPPLNVRSTPIEQPGNKVATLNNGDVLTVVSDRDGWYQISAPIAGWVYQNLTKKVCDSSPPAAVLSQRPLADSTLPNDVGSQIFQQAVSQFQAGNLKGAIALASSVPATSPAYDQAQTALKTMPKSWEQAKSKYETAQQAKRENRWSDILKIATEFPDIRFWREQLAPLVKEAIRRQFDAS